MGSKCLQKYATVITTLLNIDSNFVCGQHRLFFFFKSFRLNELFKHRYVYTVYVYGSRESVIIKKKNMAESRCSAGCQINAIFSRRCMHYTLYKNKVTCVKHKMSSYDDDTISILQSDIFYNSSEWKPITFTLVEYPRGRILGNSFNINQSKWIISSIIIYPIISQDNKPIEAFICNRKSSFHVIYARSLLYIYIFIQIAYPIGPIKNI